MRRGLSNRSAKITGLLIAVATLSILSTAHAQSSSTGFPPHPWFSVQPVGQDVLRISDHNIDNIYLILGRDSALLIDNGVGAVDLNRFVRSLTRLPLIVVNTHSHPDHTGSNHQFTTVRAHGDEIAMIRFFGTRAMRTAIAKAMQGQGQGQSQSLSLPDSVLFHETDTTYAPTIIPIRDGYVFDLGDRSIEAIHVPGHTKGSICLLDRKQKLLFTGDSFGAPIWLHPQDAMSVETYRKSVGTLFQRQKDFETLLPGHGPALDKTFMKEQMACADEIISGQCKGEPYESFAGKGMVCSYKRARIAFDPQRVKSK
jgi:glyoxylase-like metal-dependent hydrolase (beta-lactamase superfamily II)